VAGPEQPLPRPQSKTLYRVLVRNRQVLADWEILLRTRREICVRCWDHVANTPTQPLGTRYLPLKGDQSWCEFQGQKLRQWQWEVDRGARLKFGVGPDFVVLMSASTGHPKENGYASPRSRRASGFVEFGPI
jgi:hypothetical protein